MGYPRPGSDKEGEKGENWRSEASVKLKDMALEDPSLFMFLKRLLTIINCLPSNSEMVPRPPTPLPPPGWLALTQGLKAHQTPDTRHGLRLPVSLHFLSLPFKSQDWDSN